MKKLTLILMLLSIHNLFAQSAKDEKSVEKACRNFITGVGELYSKGSTQIISLVSVDSLGYKFSNNIKDEVNNLDLETKTKYFKSIKKSKVESVEIDENKASCAVINAENSIEDIYLVKEGEKWKVYKQNLQVATFKKKSMVENPNNIEVIEGAIDTSKGRKIYTNESKKEVKYIHSNLLDFDPNSIQAQFEGGINGLYKFINDQLIFPDSNATENVKANVSFTIDSYGQLEKESIEVLNEVPDKYIAEIVRILSASPKWIPAQKGEDYYVCSIRMPIEFSAKTKSIIKPEKE